MAGRCIPCELARQKMAPYIEGGKRTVVKEGTNIKVEFNETPDTYDYTVSVQETIELTISSFTVTPSLLLKGITQTFVNLVWAYNKTILQQVITAPNVTIPSITTVPRNLQLVGLNITENKTFTLVASDELGNKQRTTVLSFGNNIYVGKGPEYDATTNEATLVSFISGLTARLQTNRTGVVTCTTIANEYEYYAVPVSYGVPQFKSRTAITFGGYVLIATYNITNSAGFTEPYRIYRAVNDFLTGQIFDIT